MNNAISKALGASMIIAGVVVALVFEEGPTQSYSMQPPPPPPLTTFQIALSIVWGVVALGLVAGGAVMLWRSRQSREIKAAFHDSEAP